MFLVKNDYYYRIPRNFSVNATFLIFEFIGQYLWGPTHAKHLWVETFSKTPLWPFDFYISFFTNWERHRMRGPATGM